MLAVATTAIAFSSCKKYEEGPALSLRTKKARLAGNWEISEIKINNQTSATEGITFKFNFKKDGSGSIGLKMPLLGDSEISLGFDWEFVNSKENLKITLKLPTGIDISAITGMVPNEVEIIKLTNKEFWFRNIRSDGEPSIEMKLKKIK
jgi:hypothetical protein